MEVATVSQQAQAPPAAAADNATAANVTLAAPANQTAAEQPEKNKTD